MAKIEVSGKHIASSLYNFLVFANNDEQRPFVTFYFNNGQNPVGQLTVRDALDDDGYNKIIKYSPSESISDSSFRTFPNDRTASTFSLMECLRNNQIFYDITLVSDIPNVGIVLRAYIDSSTRYTITGGGILTIGGNYSSYTPKSPNKFVVLENTPDKQITLEKYTFDSDVSFDVTSPFEHLSFKDPITLKLLGYSVNNNVISNEAIANNNLVVLPTTLSKFQDVNLDDYFYDGYGYVDWLTNRKERSYNYGEVVALSLLSNQSGIDIEKKYFSPSGKYLDASDTLTVRTDFKGERYDFYFTLDLDTVENYTNKQVGYVEVVATHNGEAITEPMIYRIEPKCNQNNEIFFVNEIGGIDSFNFLGEREFDASIDDQTTYFKNPTRRWSDIKEIEVVGQKKNKIEHTLKTTIINSDTAKWLNELNKSKYAFVLEDNDKIKKIIVTDFDIELSDRENVFELELTYQDSDNNLNV